MDDGEQGRRQRTTVQKTRLSIPAPLEDKPEVDMEDVIFSVDKARVIRESLLHWYDLNRRDLPWRRTEKLELQTRAYAVWVSEVMLQQTRVQTVIQYYNRWMRKWPTLHHLSRASLEEVNEMWAGLGYYRRARFLLEGAKMIVQKGGVFPETVATLKKIPGIGEYTAGAIASIAFSEAVPVVDGNVIRVIARLKAISTNPKDSKTIRKFWKAAAQIVDPSRPGDFNQALMELGATLCTPLSPKCSLCPVSAQCQALSISSCDSSALVTDYPIKVAKSKQKQQFSAVCVLEIVGNAETSMWHQPNSRFLLVKRPDQGLLAGLWEFPSVLMDGETDLVTRREAIDELLNKYHCLQHGETYDIITREDVGQFVHVFTHIRLTVYIELLMIHLKGESKAVFGTLKKETMQWKLVDSKAISSMGLTSSVRKAYTMVSKFKQSRASSDTGSDKKRRRTTKKRQS